MVLVFMELRIWRGSWLGGHSVKILEDDFVIVMGAGKGSWQAVEIQ